MFFLQAFDNQKLSEFQKDRLILNPFQIFVNEL